MAENNGTITIPAFNLKSWLTGFVLGLSGKPLPLNVAQPVAYLESSDGYALQDSNGIYLIPKEIE